VNVLRRLAAAHHYAKIAVIGLTQFYELYGYAFGKSAISKKLGGISWTQRSQHILISKRSPC
jgi:hypothetical protein